MKLRGIWKISRKVRPLREILQIPRNLSSSQKYDFRVKISVLLLCLVAGLTTSFQTQSNSEPPKITKAQLRQERLQKRLSEFQQSLEKNCREDVMLRASEMVDSILIARAKAARDTIAKPPRPERPSRPEFRSPTDSTPIAPLLQQDSL